MIRVALDTNILVYLAGLARLEDDEPKIERVRALTEQLASEATLIVPAQALGELFIVLLRAKTAPEEARRIVLEFAEAFGVAATQGHSIRSATDLVVDHKLQFWDALIVTAAAEAGGSILLSEDMQHGFVSRGLTVVNPLTSPLHPKLAGLLDTNG